VEYKNEPSSNETEASIDSNSNNHAGFERSENLRLQAEPFAINE